MARWSEPISPPTDRLPYTSHGMTGRTHVRTAHHLWGRRECFSPYAVAEHAVALLMALNRKMSRAIARTNDANFSLDGLVGFDVHGKTIAVVGCGRVSETNSPQPWPELKSTGVCVL